MGGGSPLFFLVSCGGDEHSFASSFAVHRRAAGF